MSNGAMQCKLGETISYLFKIGLVSVLAHVLMLSGRALQRAVLRGILAARVLRRDDVQS